MTQPKHSHRQPWSKDSIRVLALSWIFFASLGSGLGWAFLDMFKRTASVMVVPFVIGLIVGSSLFVWSFFPSTPRRVWLWAVIAGTTTVPALEFVLGVVSFAYFFAPPTPTEIRVAQWSCVALATIIWVTVDLHLMRKRLASTRYVEREFIELDEYVAMRWDRKTNLESSPSAGESRLARVWRRGGPVLAAALAPLAGAGYGMSRFIDSTSGQQGTLLVLAVLGAPLFIYILSRTICGIYVNIWLVCGIERRTRKPVCFDHMPSS